MPKIIRLPIRNTERGAVTKNLVLAQDPQLGWKVLKPVTTLWSRTRRHGEEIYHIHSEKYIIITLMVSNTGKRSFSISISDTSVEEAARRIRPLLQMWQNGVAIRVADIISALQ